MVRKTRLKNLFRWVFILCSIGSLYFVPWIIVKAWLMPLPETVQDQVDNVINYGFDGIIVFVQKNGKDPQYYASGFHNKEKRIPADPHALFKIASITKLYEAVCVTKLISEGKLSETNVLSELLPELKGRIQYADKITLKNLVQHRSGIPNFTDTYNYWSAPKETEEECLALILDKPANFKPGEDYEYSNTNYILISRIMDRVLGYNYFEYLSEKILIPKGLKDTYESIDKIDMNRLMSGYYVGYDQDLKFEKVGTIIASAEDVGKFLRMLNEGDFFSEEEAKLYASLYKYNHTGLIPGYQSIAEYFPESKTVIVQFTNTTNFNGYEWNLSEVFFSRIKNLVN